MDVLDLRRIEGAHDSRQQWGAGFGWVILREAAVVFLATHAGSSLGQRNRNKKFTTQE